MAAVTDVDADNLLLTLLLTPEGRRDPYPLYRELRARAPVLRSAIGPLVLSGYDDCLAALREPRLGRGTKMRASGELPPIGFTAVGADESLRMQFFERAGNSMLFADPPDHTRLRRLVNRAFTPQRVEALRPAVQGMVDEILDEMAEQHDAVDVMSVLAFPLPVTVIGELVGVPRADRPGFQGLVRTAASALDPTIDSASLELAVGAFDQMRVYFAELLGERARSPADDLLTAMVGAREADDRLTQDEVIANAILLFAAGFETTTNLIGNGLLALLRHPDQLARWRDDPPRFGLGGVEELLRWDSPVQLNIRTALEPAEVAGESLARGEAVLILQGGANRDPTRFREAEVLDVGRADNAPLSFGWGIHHCLGAALARLEGEIVFNNLLARFRSIELAGDEPDWRPSLVLRGLSSLPVSVAA